MAAVRSAMKPALPYPASDESGSLPAGESTVDPWMVRPPQAGEPTIEILANPLNPDHQARAAKAMQQIERAIEAAQRKSQAQYERAISEAQRTGKSQDVDGITLGDEGVAGARVDAESHVMIDVQFNQPSYRLAVPSSLEPAAVPGPGVPGAVATLFVPAHVYRDKAAAPAEDRFCVGETQVFFGALAPPQITRRTNAVYDVTATETPGTGPAAAAVRTLVVRLRGNEPLIGAILKGTDWSQVLALLK